MNSQPISRKFVDETMIIPCIFILSGIHSCLNQCKQTAVMLNTSDALSAGMNMNATFHITAD